MQPTEKFFAASVIGESHVETGKPVQDYSLAVKGQDFCIAVVCDGHGGSKHFRSETGSRFAAEAARDKLLDFQTAYPDWELVNSGLENKLERLKVAILSEWQARIEAHERANKFTEEDLKKVSSTFTARNTFDIASPYGTTLLLALVCKDYYLVLMLGDGAIVKFSPDGSGEIIDFEGKEKFEDQPHSAVDSMCDPYSYYKMFTKCEQRAQGDGLLIALCSDGMSEAFTTDERMFAVMLNYINFVAEEGMAEADKSIPPHLRKLSIMSAAKDDVSFAFACNELSLYDKRTKETYNDGSEGSGSSENGECNTAKNEPVAQVDEATPEESDRDESCKAAEKTDLRQESEADGENGDNNIAYRAFADGRGTRENNNNE